VFLVKYYSIFTSHARISSVKDIQWKEEYANCRASVFRVPTHAHPGDTTGYEYELRLLEDLDDGRYHEELEDWSRKKLRSVVAEKGFIEGHRRHVSVHKIARLFYEHAGILLNLGESLSPVLVAKIQHAAPHPQTVLEGFREEEDNVFGPDLADGFETEEDEDEENKGARMGDIEWIAFEAVEEDESDDDEEESDEEDSTGEILPKMSSLGLHAIPAASIFPDTDHHSSLSLLEYLLRLSALQTFEQQSHMTLTDEHIVLFLRDDNPSSRQQPPSQPPPSPINRRSSLASLSSDFSSRASRPQDALPLGSPTSEHDSPAAPTEKSAPDPRTNLQRAMAADYESLTFMTPLAPRRAGKIIRVKRGSSAPTTIAGTMTGSPLRGKRRSVSARTSTRRSTRRGESS
jgi:RanGTP-binding protein